jgi:phage tail-like protein
MADEAPPSGADGAFTAARFSLTIDGVEIAQFFDIAIQSEVEPVQFIDGNDNTFQVLPGKRIVPIVTLTRGKNSDLGVFAWHQSVVEGLGFRKDCTITMFGTTGEALAKYHLENAWPSKIEISAAETGPKGSLTETVTLTCDNLQRVAP